MPPSPRPHPTLAQHFTPPHVVDLTFDLLERLYGPLASPRVIDPACGEGAFLCRALERGLTTPDRVVGIERDPELAGRLASADGPRLIVADALLGLRAPAVEGAFDLVVANPPFGTGAAGLRELDRAALEDIARTYSFAGGKGYSPHSAQTAGEMGTVPFSPERVRRFPAEILFLELCLRLARPGGHVAIILPEGILANARYRFVREWLLPQFELDAVVSFPPDTFHRTGAAARTALLVLTKQRPGAGHEVWFVEGASPPTPLPLGEGSPKGGVREEGLGVRVLQSDPALLHRLDPQYWRSDCDAVLAACRYPLRPLGDFIVKLTYGPIVTGRSPASAPGDIAIVNQPQVRFCGVDLSDAHRVACDSPWVVARAMLQPGDVVLPRSGEGSLAKHKVAVFLADEPATVGSFVDLVRLQGLNPFYLAAFLKSRLGRAQIDRIANGVGVPNLSFGEIRSLRIAALPLAAQSAIEQRYRTEVLPQHVAACNRHEILLRAGIVPRRDAALREMWEVGERRWREIVEELDAELLGTERQESPPGRRS